MFAAFALLTTSLLLGPAGSTPRTSDEEITFEQRLELLSERLEDARVSNHIPGIGFALVKDDQVVMSRGFGLANVEDKRAVGPDTLFAIGSTTKAFTSTLIGMLQDEGHIDLDDPVTKYLPYFKLSLQSKRTNSDAVTIRDLLSHRTGFTRMSLLWASAGASREAILKAATNAEPWAGFRERFLYNNVMYLAAGVAAGAAVKSEWDPLIQERIFKPLGMTSSSLSVAEVANDERLAMGYGWNEDTESFEPKPMMDLHGIGPAGSINSNVIDMAEWIRFQLARGEWKGKRLISEDAIDDAWSPSMKMGADVGYGLGWMLHEHNGRQVVEHGGNIGGFAAEVALLPEEDMGFVLLSNISMTPLQQTSIALVFDTLLEDIADEEASDEDFSEYLGNYIANFASFKDADFEVSVQNGNLAVDVPGQMNYELHLPDEEGKRYFRVTDTVAVSFQRDDSGQVVGMTMHQSGMNFEMPKEGVDVAPEIPLRELKRFLGTYRDPALESDLEVVIQNDRLAVDIPGQMVFELHAPDADGKRVMRVTSDLALRFNNDDDGQVTSLTFYERGTEREVQRVDTDNEEARRLPSLKEFFAIQNRQGRGQLLHEHGTLRETGTVRIAQCGLDGTYRYEAQLDPPAYRLTMDFGDFGMVDIGAHGDEAWSYNAITGYSEMSGMQLRQTLRNHMAILKGEWDETFDEVVILEENVDGDRTTVVARVKSGDLPSRTMYVDAANGHLLRMEHSHSEGPMTIPLETRFEDFREIEGAQVAFTAHEQNEMSGRTTQRASKIEVGVKLAPDFHAYEGE